MERSFIATKESEYVQELNKYIESGDQQKKIVKEFFIEKEIESSLFMVGGDGSVNSPFGECNKNGIRINIEPTKNDLIKFSKMLCKPDKNNMCSFKKNSIISKEFSQRCVDNQIVINLYPPRVSNYFESLERGIYGCSYSQFPDEDDLYIKISSKHLKENDLPNGFTEIKLSKFYIAKEKHEAK